MLKVYIGNKTPKWVYATEKVPEVRLVNRSKQVSYPFYLDTRFQQLFRRMITRVSQHIDTYPANIRNKIVAVQGPMGQSGDEGPWPNGSLPTSSPYYIDPQGSAG